MAEQYTPEQILKYLPSAKYLLEAPKELTVPEEALAWATQIIALAETESITAEPLTFPEFEGLSLLEILSFID